MKGWLNLQTWWFCGIKIQLHESIHSKPQYKRVHCSWEANAMTSRETLQWCEVLVKNKVLLDQHQLHINCIFHSSQAQPTLWLLQGTGDMRPHIPIFCTPPQLHPLDSLFTLYHLLWEHWREPLRSDNEVIKVTHQALQQEASIKFAEHHLWNLSPQLTHWKLQNPVDSSRMLPCCHLENADYNWMQT
jgi:hypothetical protein